MTLVLTSSWVCSGLNHARNFLTLRECSLSAIRRIGQGKLLLASLQRRGTISGSESTSSDLLSLGYFTNTVGASNDVWALDDMGFTLKIS